MKDFIFKFPIVDIYGKKIIVDINEEELYNLHALTEAFIKAFKQKKRIHKAILLTRKELKK